MFTKFEQGEEHANLFAMPSRSRIYLKERRELDIKIESLGHHRGKRIWDYKVKPNPRWPQNKCTPFDTRPCGTPLWKSGIYQLTNKDYRLIPKSAVAACQLPHQGVSNSPLQSRTRKVVGANLLFEILLIGR